MSVIRCWQDPEDIGFIPWRTTFYIAGDVNNVLLLLDGFFVWKEKSIAQSQPFQVEIHPYLDCGVAGEVWDDLDYKVGHVISVFLSHERSGVLSHEHTPSVIDMYTQTSVAHQRSLEQSDLISLYSSPQEYSYNEPAKDLPLKIFESPPPYGKLK